MAKSSPRRMQHRKQIAVTVHADVDRALRERARLSGLPLSRVVDLAVRRGLGLAEPAPPLPPQNVNPPRAAAAIAAERSEFPDDPPPEVSP